MPRVTSRDVAREAGVSQTTVSFVLNGRDEFGISEETRRLVVETAGRLGYVPSAAARSLRAGRSNVVVCLWPDLPISEATEVFKRRLSATLGHAGYTCVFLELAGLSGGLADVWRHITPAAVVALGSLADDDAAALRRASVPVVDGVLRPDAARLEGLDQEEIGRLQVRHLAERGHRVIGYAAIDDPRESPFCRPRIEGARRACAELGLAEPVVATLAYSTDSARAALPLWTGRRDGAPVTGVAAFNDLLALALLGACRTTGVRVPEDLALVGVDDLPSASLATPALSTVALDLSIPAGTFAAQVVGLIEGRQAADPDAGGQVLRLVQRESS